jgi:hypothetical protein
MAHHASTIVEAISDGKYPAHLRLKVLMVPIPMEWDRQLAHFYPSYGDRFNESTNYVIDGN